MRTIVMMTLGLLALPLLSEARAEKQDRAHDRWRTFLVLRLTEELDLSDEKALELSRIIKKEAARRAELQGKRKEVEDQVRAALERTPADTAEMARLVQEANRIDEEIALVPERTLREVQKVLTPEQQARLVLFRPALREQMRKSLRKRFREGKWGRQSRRERLAELRDF